MIAWSPPAAGNRVRRAHSRSPQPPRSNGRRPRWNSNESMSVSTLHRRRSVIVRMSEDGQVLGVEQVMNDPLELAAAVAKAGPEPEVALESTYGWYWAVDLLQENGAHVHLVHPLGLHWDSRRVK